MAFRWSQGVCQLAKPSTPFLCQAARWRQWRASGWPFHQIGPWQPCSRGAPKGSRRSTRISLAFSISRPPRRVERLRQSAFRRFRLLPGKWLARASHPTNLAEAGGAECSFGKRPKLLLVRSDWHNFRLVPGEAGDSSLADVQVLGNQRRRRAGNPVGQGDICEIGTSEDLEELQLGV